MNPPDALSDEDRFTLLLERYHEILSAGGEVDPSADTSLSPGLRQRLQRALGCLRRLQGFRPRSPPADTVPLLPERPATLPGGILARLIGRFQIVRVLGQGGGGIVFLAFDPELRREVALKVPHLAALLTPDMRGRFLREARAAARLDHPNLVPVHEVGEAGGICFLVSAYCPSGSLADWLAAQKVPVSIRLAAEMLAALADAVHYVHAHDIYHRDIKPGNILIEARAAPPGGEPALVPRLTDFGLAKLREAQTVSTRSGAVLGTLSYMAPEQAEGRLQDISLATDVYGLGAVLYEMLTGRPPFKGASDAETLRQVLMDEPTPPRRLRPDVPRDLETICLKCLHKEPARRYATAQQLADDLRRFLAHEPIQARPLRRNERLRRWLRRHPTSTALLAAGALLALVLAIGWLSWPSKPATKPAGEDRPPAGESESQRQLLYGQDMAQAWHSWENVHREDMAPILDKYLPLPGQEAHDLRGFEWHFLSRLARARPLLMRHPAPLDSLAFSSDGTTCASGHEDGVIVLWDTASGRPRRTLGGRKGYLPSLAYSRDGVYLVSAFSQNEKGKIGSELILWDARTGKALPGFGESSWELRSPAFSADGRTLATVAIGEGGASEIQLRAVPSGQLKARVSSSPALALAAAFSHDGKVLVIEYAKGRTRLCDAETGRALETRFVDPDFQPRLLACGHTRPVFASGGDGARVRLSSLQPGGLVLAEYRHRHPVRGVALSPDDGLLASISHEELKVWSCEKQREHFTRKLEGGYAVAFSPDGKSLAIGTSDGRLRIHDLVRSAEGKVGISDDAPPAEALSWLGHHSFMAPREAWAVAFSPDGKLLASAGDDGMVRLWDPADGRERAVLRGHQSLVTSIAFSPNGRLLASASFDKEGPIKLWDVAGGKEIATLNGHNNRVDCVVFSPDGNSLVSAGRDHVTYLWDVVTRKERPILTGHEVKALAFSPDGRTLALTDTSQNVLLWDVQEQIVRHTLPAHARGWVAVAFSPDGKTLATGDTDGAVRSFDADTGKPRFSHRRHSKGVNCLAFTPDGKTLASAGFDGWVKLWQTATGRELLSLPQQKDRVRWLAFSPDGRLLATASHDGVLKIYRADSGDEAPSAH